jgi:DNA polymerase III subunit delta'
MNPYFCFMQFHDVIGQEVLKTTLQDLVVHNRLSHALLFIGKEGSGALPLALAFSSFLVDYYEKKEPAAAVALDMFGEPISAPVAAIGKNLELAKQYIHPDVHYSFPTITKKTGEKPICTDFLPEFRKFVSEQPYGNDYDWLQFINAENKQGNITASECADIIRKLSLKSYQSEYKILIMWMPEYLGEQGNVLLKLIEEPPANTLFILVAADESRVLKTIISRCQTIHVTPIAYEEMEDALQHTHQLTSAIAKRIAILAEGNYREALHIMQHEDDAWFTMLRAWLNAIVQPKQRAVLVNTIDEIAKTGRENQKQLLNYFRHILQLAVKTLYENPILEHMPPQEANMAKQLVAKAGVEGIYQLMTEIDHTSYEIERNMNSKISFFALSLKIKSLLFNKSIILFT